MTKQSVDPYNVQGEIDVDGVAKAINYLNLVEEFGTQLIAADDLLERFRMFGVPLIIILTDDEVY